MASSLSGPQAPGPDATTKIEYEELQRNEIFALEAIYGDDFIQHTAAHSAWKKSDPSFDIRIKAPSDEDFAVTVGFTITATYPKTPPLLTLKGQSYLREATGFKIQKFLETQPKIFAKEAEEMVYKIVEGIQDILEDAAQAKASGKQLPSLEEERDRHEAALAKLAQEQKEKEKRLEEEEMKEQEKAAAEELQQELQRQKQKARESKFSRRTNGLSPHRPSSSSVSNGETIDFDQFCTVTDRMGNVLTFRSVTGKSDPRAGEVSTVYTVRPVLSNGQGNQLLALKEAVLRPNGKDQKEFKKQLQSLESRLQDLKIGNKIHHRHLVDILDFKVESGAAADRTASSTWTVRILSPLAERGSLEELLELAGHLEIGKVRAWTRDLLDALNFLHNKNIAHQNIHPRNILLFRESTARPPGLATAKSAYWLPPEIAAATKPQYTSKADIWDFGIVFVQMVFGLDVLRKYSSPKNLMESVMLSQPLQELVSRFFKDDRQKRPRAFELGASEFLATDAPVLFEDSSAMLSHSPSINSLQALPVRLRRDSMNRAIAVSRYTEDFVEEGRLGKGGFGEVVKARKKLDGQIYAIKKITQRSQASLTEILKEVRLLSQLSHPAVVRYYNTWVEEIPDSTDTEGETSTDDYTEDTRDTGNESAGIDIQFATSTGGLDFISSNAGVEFDYDSDEDEEDEEDHDSSDDEEDDDRSSIMDSIGHREKHHEKDRLAALQRRARMHRSYRTVLYISMEYCEKRPENIFIASSADGVDNVKIGDFGLATSGQFSVDRTTVNGYEADDMTRSIGTAYYSAPEVRSASNGMYSTKVDMYSLGIIFFEMCYLPMMGMQKADVLGQLRRPVPVLPSDFRPAEKTQTEIVLSLVNHNPKERPSSSDLLKSGKLPVQMESETIRRTLAGLADPNSPYYQKMLSTLFARPVEAAKNFAWDMNGTTPSSAELLNQSIVKNALVAIFRRHGALEATRTSIYPKTVHHADNAVRLLDSNGTVLQLPYDLTMGHARMLAKHSQTPPLQRTFTFGSVFRDKQDTGQPQMFGEVDFDIVTIDTLDLALKEAEVLKVLDEILHTFPSLSASQMCFHVGHSDILQLIFEYCGIPPSSRRAAADVLSRLNIHNHTWQKIRMELRSPAVGISATSIDELQRFDFRDTPNKAFAKLKLVFEGSDMYQRAASTIAHLKEVVEYTKRLGVTTKIYINPLNSLKEGFYIGGILFSCIYDKKAKDVFAAGGRYDHLINEQRPKIGGQFEKRHAVGFSLAWERLAKTPKSGGYSFLKKSEEDVSSIFSSKRCDILVASFDAATLRSSGIEVLRLLWSHDISAELARDSRSPEDLMSKHRDESYCWIIIIKQDSMLKIKTVGKKDVPDVDLPMAQLLSWLRPEIRDRDSKAAAKFRGAPEPTIQSEKDHEQEVKIMVAQTKSKKFNRRTVVEQAQITAATLMNSFLEGPILAVETSDHLMELVQNTNLSDPESWRRAEHGVATSEKKNIREIHDQLDTWRYRYEKKNGSKHSFLYNFRSGTCMYYDLSG
ncbi:hypothetical protein TrVFT333_000501 [Trichoderma virens FT-333]|nr:hypothetical protein TrVFT333_000501 [Trichoderma virens FT-333]